MFLLSGKHVLFDLLIQPIKHRGSKKIRKRDINTVTDLFDGRYGHAVVSPADDVVQGGLCDTAGRCKFVHRHMPLTAYLDDPSSDSITYTHHDSPFSCVRYHDILFF